MKWGRPENQKLIEAILALQTPEEARCFLRDLMTEGELNEFAKRLQTAELLMQKVPYSEIKARTGFSSTTVARVSKWLTSGKGGYRMMIDRLHYHSPIQSGRGLL